MSDQTTLVDPRAKRSGRGARAGIFAICFIIAMVIAAGSVAFIAQLDILKKELSQTRRELTAAKDRIARIERRVDEPASPQSGPQKSLSRGNAGIANGGDEASNQMPLDLSREEIQLLRDYIKVPPAPSGTIPLIGVGAIVPIGVLMPLPSQVSDKVPKLIGARFMTDRNGAIVLVRRGSRHADAIVSPN